MSVLTNVLIHGAAALGLFALLWVFRNHATGRVIVAVIGGVVSALIGFEIGHLFPPVGTEPHYVFWVGARIWPGRCLVVGALLGVVAGLLLSKRAGFARFVVGAGGVVAYLLATLPLGVEGYWHNSDLPEAVLWAVVVALLPEDSAKFPSALALLVGAVVSAVAVGAALHWRRRWSGRG